MATKTSIARKVYTLSVAERLVEVNPETEIWWDSSPLLYSKWKQEWLNEVPEASRSELDAQLTRLFNEEDPAGSLISGVTTNPPLSLQAIEGRPDIWIPWVDQLILDNPYAEVEVIFWKTYLEDSKSLYFQYNGVFSKNNVGQSIEDISSEMNDFINTEDVQRIIIDIRQNEGGDNTNQYAKGEEGSAGERKWVIVPVWQCHDL